MHFIDLKNFINFTYFIYYNKYYHKIKFSKIFVYNLAF